MVIAKADSGASDHYIRMKDANILSDLKNIASKAIIIPDGSTIQATQSGILPFAPELSQRAKTAKILPQLKSTSLISLGKLCDDGCDINLSDTQLNIF